jgi:hypothetical protein
MATNTFVEIDLPQAQNLADYTGIAFDLRTARDFATTALAENRKPQPNERFLTHLWSPLRFGMREHLWEVFE